jgi:diacylglycerol kinase
MPAAGDVWNPPAKKRFASADKFFRGFMYAFNGLWYAFRTQINFRFHVLAAVSAVILGFALEISVSEWIWISSAILVVLIVELLNTAIEVLVDLVSPGYHPKAGIIKDVSAAAVLLTALFAVLVGLFIFVPKFL